MKASDLPWNEKSLGNQEKCHTRPPKDIYDVLHMAEACGVELPESISKWWYKETCLNERREDV